MIYTDKECIIFSLIYSKIEQGRFPRQIVDLKGLYSLFQLSLEENTNIFGLDMKKLEAFIEKAVSNLKIKNPRIKEESKEKNLKDFFIRDRSTLEKIYKQADEEIELCQKNDIKYITYFSDEYPMRLKEIAEPPLVLYYKGNLPTNMELEKSLAVIGSRKPEEKYGKEIARRIGKLLNNSGWWNISGLALGCDEYGHKGSLEAGGKTGAILGHGLAQTVYPEENKELAEEILSKKGFLMSELPPSIKVSPLFFILRDRLQSGMTKGIFVVETSNKSGTLHTVKYSLEQGRKTFVWDPSFIKHLDGVEEILGNLILLNKTSKEQKLKNPISLKLRKDIVPVKDSEELYEQIKKIENKNEIIKKKHPKQELLF